MAASGSETPGPPGSSGGEGGSGKAERDLIRDALRAAQARDGAGFAFDDLPPPGTFPGYEVVRELHRGGQGVVYQAIQIATKMKVAIKVLHDSRFAGSAGKARFDREVQILGQLNHPNIVKIHDSGITAGGGKIGRLYCVMEYVSGRSLDDWIASSKNATIQDTLRLFIKICDAVNAAHLKGVIHRDLKPSNIRIDAGGEPIVLDFGLAKVATPDVTNDERPELVTLTGQFLGSLPWASPEQAEGKHAAIDVRTDVYSLGVVLYQMLTGGRFPYDVAGNMRDVLDNILRVEPARPSTVRKQINDEVETIVLKCLTKERERRYQTAGELARDLNRYLVGEPIEAKRDSMAYLLKKAVARYRVPASIAVAFLVVVVAFGITSWTLFQRAKADREAAAVNFDQTFALAVANIIEAPKQFQNAAGATRGREYLVGKAAAMLPELEARVGESAEKLRLLADAYDALGDLRGGLHRPKTGTVGEAADYFKKAAELRESLLAGDPDSPLALRDAAKSKLRTAGSLHQGRKYAEAIDLAAEAITQFDRAIAAARADGALRRELEDARAGALGQRAMSLAARAGAGLGDEQSWFDEAAGLLSEAASHWRSRASGDADGAAARELGVTINRQAGIRNSRAELLTAQVKPEGEHAARAWALLNEAEVLAADALREFESRAEATYQLRRDRALALHNLGLVQQNRAMLLEAMRKAEVPVPESAPTLDALRARAEDYFARSLGIVEDLAARDPGNLEAKRDVVLLLNKVGNQRRDTGRLDDALEDYERSLAVRRSIHSTDDTPQHVRDLAVAYYKVADCRAKIAASLAADSGRRAELHRRARDEALECRRLFQSLVAEGTMPADHRDLREVQRLIDSLGPA